LRALSLLKIFVIPTKDAFIAWLVVWYGYLSYCLGILRSLQDIVSAIESQFLQPAAFSSGFIVQAGIPVKSLLAYAE
jgi:hypothetical protein